MSRRVALVTGTGAGSLGEATAAALRAEGYRVLTTTRACAEGEDQHPLELTDRESVARLAGWVQRTTDRVDVLVNNAGIHLDLPSRWTEPALVEGYEVHWRTNYLGTAQLTRLLLPVMLATAEREGEARVVNVVSRLHARGRNEGLDGHLVPYDSGTAYGTSKLALVHEARELERRYGERGLHAYAVHPGVVSTGLLERGLAEAPLLRRLRRVLMPLERRGLPQPHQGARTTVFCATSPLAQPGGYHRGSAPSAPASAALDDEAGRLLWEATSRWVEEP